MTSMRPPIIVGSSTDLVAGWEPRAFSYLPERRRAELILGGLLPISRKADGLRTDAFWAGTPTPTEHARITVPTLITCGQHDELTPACALRMKLALPDAELHCFPNSSHMPFYEEGEKFGTVLRRFLAR